MSTVRACDGVPGEAPRSFPRRFALPRLSRKENPLFSGAVSKAREKTSEYRKNFVNISGGRFFRLTPEKTESIILLTSFRSGERWSSGKDPAWIRRKERIGTILYAVNAKTELLAYTFGRHREPAAAEKPVRGISQSRSRAAFRKARAESPPAAWILKDILFARFTRFGRRVEQREKAAKARVRNDGWSRYHGLGFVRT